MLAASAGSQQQAPLAPAGDALLPDEEAPLHKPPAKERAFRAAALAGPCHSNPLLHPSAKLFHFLLAAGSAADSISFSRLFQPAPGRVPAALKQPLPDDTARLFMSPQAEDYHWCNPAVAPAARHHLKPSLPLLELLLAAARTLMAAAGGGMAVALDCGTADGLLRLEELEEQLMAPHKAPTALVLYAAMTDGPAEVAVCLPVHWSAAHPAAAAAGGATSPGWVLLDPSGAFEHAFDQLEPGVAFYSRLGCPGSSCNGSSACHVLFALLGYASGLLDFTSGLPGLDNSTQQLLGPLDDAGFALSCLVTLLLEGQVSIGLLGVRLGNGSDSEQAADQVANQMLAAWQAAVDSGGCATGSREGRRAAAQHGNVVTWADVHDLADVLHHLDGYSTDSHTLFVSCHNRSQGAWHLASADLSLPLYKQQRMRWMHCSSSSSDSSSDSSGLTASAPSQRHRQQQQQQQQQDLPTAPACSEVILHYGGAHFTTSIINHQQRVMLYFDSLGGSCPPLAAPAGYATVCLSRRIQGSATCGPHALFVALAYAADLHGLRSACASPPELPSQPQHLQPACEEQQAIKGLVAERSAVTDQAAAEGRSKGKGRKDKRRHSPLSGSSSGSHHKKKAKVQQGPQQQATAVMGSRAAQLQAAVAACYGRAAAGGGVADVLVSAACRAAAAVACDCDG